MYLPISLYSWLIPAYNITVMGNPCVCIYITSGIVLKDNHRGFVFAIGVFTVKAIDKSRDLEYSDGNITETVFNETWELKGKIKNKKRTLKISGYGLQHFF